MKKSLRTKSALRINAMVPMLVTVLVCGNSAINTADFENVLFNIGNVYKVKVESSVMDKLFVLQNWFWEMFGGVIEGPHSFSIEHDEGRRMGRLFNDILN